MRLGGVRNTGIGLPAGGTPLARRRPRKYLITRNKGFYYYPAKKNFAVPPHPSRTTPPSEPPSLRPAFALPPLFLRSSAALPPLFLRSASALPPLLIQYFVYLYSIFILLFLSCKGINRRSTEGEVAMKDWILPLAGAALRPTPLRPQGRVGWRTCEKPAYGGGLWVWSALELQQPSVPDWGPTGLAVFEVAGGGGLAAVAVFLIAVV